jgi:tetratricopeptide (TPR) repeat protein
LECRPISGTSILKKLMLTGLCGLLIVLVAHLDLPAFQDLTDSIQLKFVERQFEAGIFDEQELLREGWLYYNLGKYEKARQLMEQVKGEANISAIYCLGLIDMKYRQFANAAVKFNIVTDKSPGHVASRVVLGQAYYQLQYWRQAAQEFEQAVELEPTNETARFWLGKTYISLNQTEKARSVLETVTHGQESVKAAALLKEISEKGRP